MKVVEQGDEGADAFKWNWMMTSLVISVLLLLLYITVIIIDHMILSQILLCITVPCRLASWPSAVMCESLS